MLGDHLVFPILLSRDLDASRAYYNGVLGLESARRRRTDRLPLQPGSMLSVTLSTVGTANSQTQLAWRVPDIHAELEDLRARGVRIESYAEPDPVTDADGIADMDYVWAAWFIDPSGNALSIVQPKTGPTPPSRQA